MVKARNRIDSRIYAGMKSILIFRRGIAHPLCYLVKKVRLRTTQSDKIFREVNALSRLSHRFIVRYYTTWVETAEPSSTAASDESDAESSEVESDTEDGMTSVPSSSVLRTTSADEGFIFSLDDLDDPGASRGSFPSIHFSARSSEAGEEDTDSDGDPLALDNLFQPKPVREAPPPPFLQRTLYIQMVIILSELPRSSDADGNTIGIC